MTQNKNLNFPKLIGHRGVKDLCPENTIESINNAFDLGLKCVEIDVKISKDEIPILLHDDTLDRTSNGSGLPINYTYSEIRKLDAGEFFYKKKTNNYIPKLIDVLIICESKKKNLNIEFKPNKGYEKINVHKIFELIKKINIEIFFSTFDIISLIEISKISINSNRSFLIDTFNDYSLDDFINILKKYKANICGLNIELISIDIVKKLKENDLFVTVYSDNNIDLSRAAHCFDMGIDSIFTDNPIQLLKYL